ncbi:hypothetical protein SD77_4226 [Bacillus badius]|uniref:Uncharacterized protein n=1 Tax=Bacillus badius TaxID=1455 RepID=A0ABR5AUX2_BACBA|nr:hypothetical protein SD77_4226 [Bacillus badius]
MAEVFLGKNGSYLKLISHLFMPGCSRCLSKHTLSSGL